VKKSIIFLGLTGILFHGLYGTNVGQWSSARMILAGNEAFGRDWIFKAPVNKNGLQLWQDETEAALGILRNYVKNNKKNHTLLNDCILQINNASYDLINGIKITYNNMFSPVGRKSITTAQMRLEKKIQFRPLFDSIVDRMLDLKLKISVARKKTKSVDLLAAYDIIDDIAQLIINTARKAAKSVDYLE